MDVRKSDRGEKDRDRYMERKKKKDGVNLAVGELERKKERKKGEGVKSKETGGGKKRGKVKRDRAS